MKVAKTKEEEEEEEKKTWIKCWSDAAEVRDRHGEMCGLSAGDCVGSVISGREWCIIIQNVMPVEGSWEVNQMMEEPVILLFPSIAAPESSPFTGVHSSRHSATHQYRNGEHGAEFTVKSEQVRGEAPW